MISSAPAPSISDEGLGVVLDRLVRSGSLKGHVRRYCARESIYHIAGSDRTLCLVKSGHVKVSTHSMVGKDCVQHIYGEGDVFGETSFDDEYFEVATALNDAVVLKVSWDACTKLIPELLIGHLRRRLVERRTWITHLTTLPAEHRLIHYLIAQEPLAARSQGVHSVRIPVTQHELAALIGTTRSRVGLFLRQLEGEGAIILSRGRVAAVDVERLETLLDERLSTFAE